ncbi:MAG: bifunctional hydroxymethylpyrimidine kinase/phosphomethylpyrimidine kinase [Candidatus Melainabacteria bacterium]|nr:MAG: bifunctional hydroxymethylpyrimidine kinase/phosphomethylpyrimidine kinase [Candidatus Melainabacteria bacterium]
MDSFSRPKDKDDSPERPKENNPSNSSPLSDSLNFTEVYPDRMKKEPPAKRFDQFDLQKMSQVSKMLEKRTLEHKIDEVVSQAQNLKPEGTLDSRVSIESIASLKELLKKTLESLNEDSDDSFPLNPLERNAVKEATQSLIESGSIRDFLSNSLYLAFLYQYLGCHTKYKKTVQLSLSIDPNNTLVQSIVHELQELNHLQRSSKESQNYTQTNEAAVAMLSKSALRKRIIELGRGSIIVLGDLLIDELLEGNPERISREAPVLILEHVATTNIPGGAANTANNITALGGKCHAIGVCGEDDYARKMAQMLERHGITYDLVADSTRPTTVKTRILSKSHSLMQQLLRLDRIAHHSINDAIERKLLEKLEKAASGHSAIILSDYKAGTITDTIIEACRKISDSNKNLLVVDAQNRFERFNGCALITPNQPDTEAALGFKINSHESLMHAGSLLMKMSGAKSILITRGPHGMALFQENKPIFELPPFNKSEVFDVSGAGDTVIATMTLALVTGARPEEAMALGNLAAGIVVRKPGTAVTSQKEMLEALDSTDLPF